MESWAENENSALLVLILDKLTYSVKYASPNKTSETKMNRNRGEIPTSRMVSIICTESFYSLEEDERRFYIRGLESNP